MSVQQKCYLCGESIDESSGTCACGKTHHKCPYCGRWVILIKEEIQMHKWIEKRRQLREQARQKVCPVCVREFRARRCDGEYCSGACRQKAYRSRVTAVGAAPRQAPVTVTHVTPVGGHLLEPPVTVTHL